jgi:hypothetical protein
VDGPKPETANELDKALEDLVASGIANSSKDVPDSASPGTVDLLNDLSVTVSSGSRSKQALNGKHPDRHGLLGRFGIGRKTGTKRSMKVGSNGTAPQVVVLVLLAVVVLGLVLVLFVFLNSGSSSPNSLVLLKAISAATST